MPKSKLERRNPLLIDKSEPVSLFTAPGGTPPPNLSRLKPGQIRMDGGTQMRAGLNEETVVEYLDLILEPNEWPFPPVVVFHDGEAYWMGDGFHRVEAARRYVQREQVVYSVVAEVRSGPRRDAVLWAAGANAAHGLRRTNADKHRAVETLLRDEEWGQWSDREIARRCAVSQPFVSKLRIELSDTDNGYQYESDQRTFVHPKTGRPTSMNITGRREATKMRTAAAPALKPPLTVDETLALIWNAIRTFVRSNDPGDQLAWLASLPDDYGFYRDTPAERSMAPETLQTAKAHVIAGLQGQLARRESAQRAPGRRATLQGNQDALAGLDLANGVETQDFASLPDQENAAEWLTPSSGRRRLPSSARVSKLLNLYQEVLATLDEYSGLVVDDAEAEYAEEALRVISAMIVALEKGGVQAE
ncbi:MAG TPA: hypothetical protein PKE45_00690 [Caldilineaceae bacterium]|nr:hypothetical protein [Caldilineaceae bacterium]